ncbi:MAG: Rne/Rng family ribonuclease [Bacteroidales bacterium]|nr:Rne/Rng family ribonuclease [Bacteroidales bacterium]
MQSELYVDVRSSEIRIALLHNKKLVELNRETNKMEFAVGDVYLGKVKKIMPGLNAAFIDIGSQKDAFLHYLDLGAGFQSLNKFLNILLSNKQKYINISQIPAEPDIDKNGKISDVLKVGQFVLVQIEKEAISTKGPRLTCEISIAGRNIILMPFNTKISVSQKIASIEEKTRLVKLIESITPANYGVIVRTIAEKKMVAELDKELQTLIDKWETLLEILPNSNSPKLVIGEVNRTIAFLRDMLNPSFNQIVSNDKIAHEAIKSVIEEIAPEKRSIVKYYTGSEPIFDHFGVEKQIKSTFGKIVPLRNGAYLIIEKTEAAHVIDVNSGNKYNSFKDQEDNAFEVNVVAAEEIARQLRLRDLGGIIIIDFIDIHEESNKKNLLEKMKEFMDGDKAKFYVLPLSKFCLMEITRQRVRPETEISTEELCPSCNGRGKISASILLTDEIENNIKYVVNKHDVKNIILKTHPYIEAFLTKGMMFSSLKSKWQRKYNCKIEIIDDISYGYTEYHIIDRNINEEIIYKKN